MSEPDETALELLRRRIDCPVPWCGGLWIDHGGDGAEPEAWLHDETEGIDLPYGTAFYRSQQGAGPLTWSLVVGGVVIARGSEPRRLAAMLRDVAAAVEQF